MASMRGIYRRQRRCCQMADSIYTLRRLMLQSSLALTLPVVTFAKISQVHASIHADRRAGEDRDRVCSTAHQWSRPRCSRIYRSTKRWGANDAWDNRQVRLHHWPKSTPGQDVNTLFLDQTPPIPSRIKLPGPRHHNVRPRPASKYRTARQSTLGTAKQPPG
jgi:hypothetical protein